MSTTGNIPDESNLNFPVNGPNNGGNINLKTGNEFPYKPFFITLGITVLITGLTLAIAIPIINSDNNKRHISFRQQKNETEGELETEEELFEEHEHEENEYEINEEEENEYNINDNNYIKATINDEFVIPEDGSVQVIGSDYPEKENIIIYNANGKSFKIDKNGFISNITKEDFPLYFSFNNAIINGSCLFKDVKCFKTIDLSKMDSSNLIYASNMFENSNFEEIYFGPNFNTRKLNNVSYMFMNCPHLKIIKFPPSFNVGKSAKGMFKGCHKLEQVNTSCLISTEIEEMESMFEDCRALKEISFSNNFLTGEVKSLANAFKNTHLTSLDISFLRLYNLQTFTNIFEGAWINGTLKIGRHYPNDNIRNNFLKEIVYVTNPNTIVYAPSGTNMDQIFKGIYYTERHIDIPINVIDIDYNINYREDEDYILYSNYFHVGLGWDYNVYNVYDLDSSILALDEDFNYISRVNFEQLTTFSGAISLNGDDVTGEGGGDDEEIRIYFDLLPLNVKILTVQLNSFRGNPLVNVRSAYIRLSTQTEVIGTYSITQAGNNIGLLIGCFIRSNSNSWSFKPLNRVISGRIVTQSITDIQRILRTIYPNN